jgi:protein-L-isoaspartate(D-aspartate) O-methyltransferase
MYERTAEEWRERMVQEQLAARGIRDLRVLAAMREVPRHRFCPPGTPLADAYGDFPLAIGLGQTISQPWMVAYMAAVLGLCGDESVLEIGTGSGYGAAVLAKLAARVHSVERLPELAERARERLAELGVANAFVHVGDGSRGWPADAPYAAVVVTAGAPTVPEPLKAQLRDGGRLTIPVGDRHVQELLLLRRCQDRFAEEARGGCRFVPLLGQFGWQ